MSDTANRVLHQRTAEQKAEERRIRELHRTCPVRDVPTDTISGEDVAEVLSLIAAIRRERESKGLTIDAMAQLARIEPELLTRLESGLSFNPSISTLLRLARAVECSLALELPSGK